MKKQKKFISVVLSVILIFSVIAVSPVNVSADDNVIYQKLMALQSRFPDGKFWNHYVSSTYDYGDNLSSQADGERFSNNVTSSPCATHTVNMNLIGKYDCNYFDGGLQCFGFAGKIFYEVFNQRKSQLSQRTDIYNVRVGDYVRINNDTHSAVVLSRNGDYFTAVECNLDGSGPAYNCKIRWGWTYKISSINYFIHATNYDQIANVHTHSYSSTIIKQPTCTESGIRKYTCSCGNSYTETINAKGHNYTKKVVKPTTTQQGYTQYTCSACGHSYKDNYIDPPVLNADGWYYCDVLPEGVSASNSTIQYNNYYEKIQQNSPGSDWTNSGVVKNEWQNSGAQYESPYDLETSEARILISSSYYHFCGPNAGNEGNYEMTGKFVHYDGVNPSSVTAQYLGDDNGHPYYFLYWADGSQVWCNSSTTCDGSNGSHGNRCRAWYKKNTYQDRVKIELYKYTKNSGWISTQDTSANKVKVRYKALKEFEYTVLENGTAQLTAYNGSSTNVVIPSSIDNYTVTGLYKTFYNMKNLESVTIPSTVTNIGDSTFYYCENLKNITIPDSVNTIGRDAFSYCKSLKSVKIPYGVKTLVSTFMFCSSLEEVTLPDSITDIGSLTFTYCTNIKKIVIPDSVTKIASISFRDCLNMNSIIIPSTVESIGDKAFGYFYNYDVSGTPLEKIDGFTIYGYIDTAAEKYAYNNGFTFIPLDGELTIGDIDLDGEISVTDATLLQKHIAEINNLGSKSVQAGDCDSDNQLSIQDATYIQKYIAELSDPGNVGKKIIPVSKPEYIL